MSEQALSLLWFVLFGGLLLLATVSMAARAIRHLRERAQRAEDEAARLRRKLEERR